MFRSFCTIVCVSALTVMLNQTRTPVLNGLGVNEFYLDSASSRCAIVSVNGDVLEKFSKLTDVTGEHAFKVEIVEAENFLKEKNARLVFEERLPSLTVQYWYSEEISAYKSINGKKFNIHTAFDGSFYSVGTPMIYGGF